MRHLRADEIGSDQFLQLSQHHMQLIYHCYRINKWSLRHLRVDEIGHDQFFKGFQFFGELSSDMAMRDNLLEWVAARGAAQGNFYQVC
jgi:hypothetical protein